MLLKRIVVSTFVCIVSAKQNRRHFKRHQSYLAKNGGVSQIHFDMPGSEALFDSLIDKEVETDWKLVGIDEDFEKEDRLIAATLPLEVVDGAALLM